MFRQILKDKGGKKWAITSASIIAFLLVATIVLTCIIPSLMDLLFGGPRKTQTPGGSNQYYTASEGVTDKKTSFAFSDAVNQSINDEGITLLKNQDNVLPISSTAKISVFGKNSVNLVYGSSGSGGGETEGFKTLYDSLDAVGVSYNTTLKDFYNSSASGRGRPANPPMDSGYPTGYETGETAVSMYTQAVKDSFAEYNDLALVVISRTGGETFDLPMSMKQSNGSKVNGAASAEDHYLELDQNEQDMLQMVCENFNNVVLVINSNTTLELGFLDAIVDGDSTFNNYNYADKVKGALWIGAPGYGGIMALGRVLVGQVNPSGRTVDTYARDFTKMPSTVNFSSKGVDNFDNYIVDGKVQDSWFIDYEEGIYVGYRYYETRGETDGEEWYTNNVVFPFGYGLSYTTFSQEITSITPQDGGKISKNSEIKVAVEVTNTGAVAGKQVVQIYVSTPYVDGQIEKASVVLMGYAKTSLLQPGASEQVEIVFDAYDFASYDYSDANNNGFVGYELDAGDYVISLRTDSHTVCDSCTLKVDKNIQYPVDPTTEYTVENRYSEADDQLGTVLSRSDWEGTWPQPRTQQEKATTSEFIASLRDFKTNNPLTATSKEVAESNLTVASKKVKEAEIQLHQLIGLDYNDPLWDRFLEQLTPTVLFQICDSAAFNTKEITYVGKPLTIDADGPAGFVCFMGGADKIFQTYTFANECVVAATWNDDLAYQMGIAIGNEGLIGNTNDGTPYSGWYAPGCNIHRTPFGGRNSEYYSEDAILSGNMTASVVRGAEEKGVHCYVKHFAVNDQETHRNGVCTWLTEQSLREIYLKPFEKAVKDGKTTAIMSSFNRIGNLWTGGDYRLLTEILRNEWGFQGAVICDFVTGNYMDFKQMAYAGGDLYLNGITSTSYIDAKNTMDIYVAKKAAKNVLYTVANSNAMNGLGEGITYTYKMAYWRIVLIVVDCLAVVGLAAWGFVTIKKIKNKKV